MRDTFANTMLEVGQNDPNLMVLVGDISHFALQPFAKACPGRYYNIGICEPTIVGLSAGLSEKGFHPVVHTIAPFLIERAFEQIKLDYCYQELGGNLVSVGSAFDYTGLGCSHYCYDDIALIKAIPETQIIYPASPIEFSKLFNQTYSNKKLTYFRLPKEQHHFEFSEKDIEFGKGIICKEGSDLTIVAVGPQLKTAITTYESLKKEGIYVEVIYLHTIKPFDYELVRASIEKTKKYVVIEEHSVFGGVTDEVRKAIEPLSHIRGDSIAIPDKFLHAYGTYQEHCNHFGFTTENLRSKVLSILNLN